MAAWITWMAISAAVAGTIRDARMSRTLPPTALGGKHVSDTAAGEGSARHWRPSAAGTGRHLVGHVDVHAQQRRGVGLAEVVTTKAPRCSPAERLVHHELERQHIGRLEPLDPALDQVAEVLLHPLGRDLGLDRLVGGLVVGEQRKVADVTLVAGAAATEVSQLDAGHQTSSMSTRTWLSTSWVGRPSRPRPVELIVGGPERPRTPVPCDTRPADSASAVRHARRPITS